MVNEFELTVVHVAHPNLMQICACSWIYADQHGQKNVENKELGHWPPAVLVTICHNLFILKSSALFLIAPSVRVKRYCLQGFVYTSFRNSLFKDMGCHTYCAWCSKGTIHRQSMKTSFNLRKKTSEQNTFSTVKTVKSMNASHYN